MRFLLLPSFCLLSFCFYWILCRVSVSVLSSIIVIIIPSIHLYSLSSNKCAALSNGCIAQRSLISIFARFSFHSILPLISLKWWRWCSCKNNWRNLSSFISTIKFGSQSTLKKRISHFSISQVFAGIFAIRFFYFLCPGSLLPASFLSLTSPYTPTSLSIIRIVYRIFAKNSFNFSDTILIIGRASL